MYVLYEYCKEQEIIFLIFFVDLWLFKIYPTVDLSLQQGHQHLFNMQFNCMSVGIDYRRLKKVSILNETIHLLEILSEYWIFNVNIIYQFCWSIFSSKRICFWKTVKKSNNNKCQEKRTMKWLYFEEIFETSFYNLYNFRY